MSAQEHILSTLQRFRTGWERGDAQQIISTVAENAEVLIIGTDRPEHWQGHQAFAQAVPSQVAAMHSPSYTWEKGHPHIQVMGKAAWAYGVLHVTIPGQGESLQVAMRSTFVLADQGKAGWQIVHAHFSIGQETSVVEY